MSGNLESKLRERLEGQELQAPDLMSSIYQKRSAWYVFMNRVRLNRMKVMAAATLLVALVLTFVQFNSKNQPSVANQEISQPSIEKSIVVEEATNNIEDQEAEAMISVDDQQPKIETNTNTYTTTTETSSQKLSITNQENAITKGQDVETITKPSNAEWTTAMQKAGQETGAIKQNPEEDYFVDGAETLNETNPIVNSTTSDHEIGTIVLDEQEPEQQDPSTDMNESQASPTLDDNTEIASVGDDSKTDESLDESEARGNNDGDDFSIADRPRKWAVSMAYGAGLGARAISSSLEGDAVSNRNASESQKLSNSLDLAAYYRINPHVEAVFGVNYFGRREQLGYTKSTSVQKMNVTSRQVIEIHPIYGQRLVTKYDTSYNSVIETADIKKSNLYHHVTVPVGLRYTEEFTNAPKWSVSLQAQYGLEVVSKLNATVLDGLNQEVSLAGQERTNLGHVISAGGALNYHLNNRVILLFEPRATMYLTPMMRREYRIEQTDRALTGYVGFKYTL